MSTGAIKYEPGQGKGHAGPGTAPRSLLSKAPTLASLSAEDRELVRVTLEARDEWIETNTNFEHVHEDLLVDYYTYRIKACEARYTYFLRLVKERGLARFL